MQSRYLPIKALRLAGLITIFGLLTAEASFIPSSARASALLAQTNSQPANSYRCKTGGGIIERVRVTYQNGLPATVTIDMGNTNVTTYNVSDVSDVGGGKAYMLYDTNSNITYKFIEYSGGRGRLIFSTEDANGRQTVQDDAPCFKINS